MVIPNRQCQMAGWQVQVVKQNDWKISGYVYPEMQILVYSTLHIARRMAGCRGLQMARKTERAVRQNV